MQLKNYTTLATTGVGATITGLGMLIGGRTGAMITGFGIAHITLKLLDKYKPMTKNQ